MGDELVVESGGGSDTDIAVSTTGLEQQLMRLHCANNDLTNALQQIRTASWLLGQPLELVNCEQQASVLLRNLTDLAVGLATSIQQYTDTEQRAAMCTLSWPGAAQPPGGASPWWSELQHDLFAGIFGQLAGVMTGTAPLGFLFVSGPLENARTQAASALLGATANALMPSPFRGVGVHQTTQSTAAAPGTVGELVRRIPTGADQIRIERYDTTAGTRWVVYVAGTASPTVGSAEPFDMKSNLEAVAGQRSDSETALRQAMSQAGMAKGDEVMLVGHSQGGLLAARIAEDSPYSVVECVTVGAPLGTAETDVPSLAIVHRDDAVPQLAGATEPAANRITVTTESGTSGGLLAAHELSAYARTADRVDASPNAKLLPAEQRIRDFASGPATVQTWRAERTAR